MKKVLFILLSLSVSMIYSQVIPNTGFEIWDDISGEPLPWGTNNNAFSPFTGQSYPFVVKDTATANRNSGKFSVSLTTQNVNGNNVPGMCVNNGIISYDLTAGLQITGGLSYTLIPDSLVVYAKYINTNADTAHIIAAISKWNGITNSRDTLGFIDISPASNDATLKRYAALIDWTQKITPDSLRLVILSSGARASNGTVLYVDDIMLTSSTPTLPQITPTTYSQTNVTTNSATTGGEVLSDGLAETTYGVVYSAYNNPPTISDSLTVDGVGTGTFTSVLSGLKNETVYYARAYAKNSEGVVYGSVITFTTLAVPKPPTLSTLAINNVTGSFAVSGGNIISNGGAAVTQSGVVWGTSSSPKLPSSNITTDNATSGTFKSFINNLSPNTPYYVRAYAINSVDTSYGNEISFTTKQLITGTPNLDFETWVKDKNNRDSASYWTSNTSLQFVTKATAAADRNGGTAGIALATFSITNIGIFPGVAVYGIGNNAQVSQAGIKGGMPYSARNDSLICYAKYITSSALDSGAVIALFTKWNTTTNLTDTIGEVGITEFTSSMKRYAAPIEWSSNQTPDSVVFLLASSIDIAKAAGGSKIFVDDISLKNAISPAVKPTVSLTSVSNIKFSSTELNGYVSSNGGLSITERGFYIDTLPMITAPNNNSIKLVAPLSNKVATYSVTATNLVSSKLYYVVAYAINSMGTSYSSFSQFYTKGPLTISTTSVTTYNSTKANVYAKITSTQNEPVISSGFVWSTLNNPANLVVSSGSKINLGSVSSVFSGLMTNLLPQTTYYIRSYGITNIDTAYGNILSYSTPAPLTCTPDPSITLVTPGIFPKTPTPIDTISLEVNQTFTYSLPRTYTNSKGNVVVIDSSRLDDIVDLPQGLSIECGRVSKTANPSGIGPNCIFYPDELGCFLVKGTLPTNNGQSYPMSFKITDWGLVNIPGLGSQYLNTTNPGYISSSVVLTFEEEVPLDVKTIDQNKFDIVQSYPNPFTDNFTIKFTNPQGGDVLFTVVDMFGREIHNEIVNAQMGLNKLTFISDGISSGAYYFTLTNGNQKVVKLGIAVK